MRTSPCAPPARWPRASPRCATSQRRNAPLASATTIRTKSRLPDPVPAGSLVAGRVVDGADAVRDQGGGAAAGVVGCPAGVAGGDEVNPDPVGSVRDRLCWRVADERTGVFPGGGIEHERDLGR